MNEVRRGLWRLLAQSLHNSASALSQWAQHATQRLEESDLPPQLPAPTEESVADRQEGPPQHWLDKVDRSQAPAHWLEYIASRAPHLLTGDAMLSYGNVQTSDEPFAFDLEQEQSPETPSQLKVGVTPRPSQSAQSDLNNSPRSFSAQPDRVQSRPQPERRASMPLKLRPTPTASMPERVDQSAQEPPSGSSAPTAAHERHAQERLDAQWPALPPRSPMNLAAQELAPRQATPPTASPQGSDQRSEWAKRTQPPSSPTSHRLLAANFPGADLSKADPELASSVPIGATNFSDAAKPKPSDASVGEIQSQWIALRPERSVEQWPWQRMTTVQPSTSLLPNQPQSNPNLPRVANSATAQEPSRTRPVLRTHSEQNHPFPSLPRAGGTPVTTDSHNQPSVQSTSSARIAATEHEATEHEEGQPIHDRWPELPDAMEEDERAQHIAAQAQWRSLQRRRRLDDEQKGRLWNE